MLRKVLGLYKIISAPLIGNNCRFHPNCSDYCIQAIEEYGFLKGCALAIYRFVRCNPWSAGGDDPVKKTKTR